MPLSLHISACAAYVQYLQKSKHLCENVKKQTNFEHLRGSIASTPLPLATSANGSAAVRLAINAGGEIVDDGGWVRPVVQFDPDFFYVQEAEVHGAYKHRFVLSL